MQRKITMQEFLSCLKTEVEHKQRDFYFKAKSYSFLQHVTVIGGICARLEREGIIQRCSSPHASITWKTNLRGI